MLNDMIHEGKKWARWGRIKAIRNNKKRIENYCDINNITKNEFYETNGVTNHIVKMEEIARYERIESSDVFVSSFHHDHDFQSYSSPTHESYTTDVNPASGLAIVGASGGIDTSGNPYGCDNSFSS
ncbi:hypothetical protein OAO18_04045 [Francisellaceae bacterium]|nr:hypothetical protein [Francisellaceae bacterium]